MKTRVFNLIIVDESGSMSTIRREAFAGMNETLQTIKQFTVQQPDIEQRVTLITFDSNHTRYHYDNADGQLVCPLRPGDYCPGGATPLYDAVGMGISKLNGYVKEGDAVLVTIITDGYENCSREFTLSMVKNMIEKLKKQEWTFTFIGTDDLNVEGMAADMGINHTLAFAREAESAKLMFEADRRARGGFIDKVKKKLVNPSTKVMDDDGDFFSSKHV